MNASPVTNFAKLAASRGWLFETAWTDHEPNPEALEIAGTRYATLVSADGLVKVGLVGTRLYHHDGRVWWGDPCFDVEPDRVTIAGIVVDPAHRRQGLGTAAVRSILAVADQGGFRLLLEAQPIGKGISRRKLVQWYKGLGFEPAYPGEGETILCHRPKTPCFQGP